MSDAVAARDVVAAIDVGGTFTDIVLRRSGERWIAKTPTTPDPTDGVLTGLAKACEAAGLAQGDVTSLHYGTTAAVNALLTRRGARVGLLVTDGFGQVLHLARSQTPGPLVGWLRMAKPDPLADLEDTVEIYERTRADGTVETPLDEAQVEAAVRRLAAAGIETIAICFLHSYANPANERRAGEIARAATGLSVTLSSEVLPEYREYERCVTTVANAYVLPAVSRYLGDFERRLAADGWQLKVDVVRSDGGLMSAAEAAARPVATIFSGPSGGVAGALAVSRAAGFDDILTIDMGGTSADVAVCIGGASAVARETFIGDFPIRSASVDVRSIGAGGGSLAHLPELVRSLRVGPESAGAFPGPACYRRGGERPTVTDANLLLGRLTDQLVGGEMTLDREASARVIAALAEPLGLDPLDAAQGIIDIVDENMAGALRVVTVERGLDPRSFALVAFGGAGPLHGNALAALLGCYPVIVPHSPGVLSAYGFQTVGHRASFTRTVIRDVGPATEAELLAAFEELAVQARGHDELSVSCDMRFFRQGYELEVGFAEEELRPGWAALAGERFRAEHRRLYGFVPAAEMEVVNLRVEGRGAAAFTEPAAVEPSPGDGAQALVRTTQVYVGRRWQDAAVYDRALLVPGDRFPGPAVVTQPDTTTFVLPAHVVVVDARGNLLIDREERP